MLTVGVVFAYLLVMVGVYYGSVFIDDANDNIMPAVVAFLWPVMLPLVLLFHVFEVLGKSRERFRTWTMKHRKVQE